MSVGCDLTKWKRYNDVYSFLDNISFGAGSCCCGGFSSRCYKDIPTAAPRPGPRPGWDDPREWYYSKEENSMDKPKSDDI
jgi:hypothetical protein